MQDAEKLRVGMEQGHSMMTGQIAKRKALLSHQDGEGCRGLSPDLHGIP